MTGLDDHLVRITAARAAVSAILDAPVIAIALPHGEFAEVQHLAGTDMRYLRAGDMPCVAWNVPDGHIGVLVAVPVPADVATIGAP